MSTSEADQRFHATTDRARFGDSLFYIPDVDGDGKDELVFPYSEEYDAAELGAVAVYLGGYTGSGSDQEADLRLYADDGAIDMVTWGDFDDDGTDDLAGRVDYLYENYYVAWFPLSRGGQVEVSSVLHAVPNGEDVWLYSSLAAWRREDAPDALVVQLSPFGGATDCYHLYEAPIHATTLDEYTAVVRSDDVWTECETSSTVIGDVTGTGLSSFAFRVDDVEVVGGAEGGLAIFDELPVGDAVLSDLDHAVFVGENGSGPPSTSDRQGDFDGDGYQDLLVHAWYVPAGADGYCSVVIPGPIGEVSYAMSQSTRLCVSDDGSTWSPKGGVVGDFDGDGHLDLLEGGAVIGVDFAAVAGVYYGPIPAAILTPEDADLVVRSDVGATGGGIALGGDFDGDGRDDLVRGAYGATVDDVASGAAYLFYGR